MQELDGPMTQQGSSLARARARRILSAIIPRWLPLGLRQKLVIMASQLRLPGRYWLPMELLQDFAEEYPDEFHAFLWRHHLAYASTYEVEGRFGSDRLNQTRRTFFADLRTCMTETGTDPLEIDSVLEVGCSLGYLLQFMESDVFPNATILEGIDVDAHAVRAGNDHLHVMGSKVRLAHDDMRELPKILARRTYDVVVCTGVLMYLGEPAARETVRTMLNHANKLVAIAGLAHPQTDNAHLQNSTMRSRDRTFIHNIDEMVSRSGGKILARRWQGDHLVDGNTVYFVLAAPRGLAARTS